MNAFPWATLGIAPTTDNRAIRRAYADRLRQIDPEADPAGFIALRQALTLAQRDAGAATPRPTPEAALKPAVSPQKSPPPPFARTLLVSSTVIPSPFARAFVPLPPFPQAPTPATIAKIASANDASTPVAEEYAPPRPSPASWRDDMRELQRLVSDPTVRPDLDDLAERTRRILHDPALTAIDEAHAAEEWMALLAGRNVPRSDPVLLEACYFYEWPGLASQWDCPPVIKALVGRFWDLEFLKSLELSSVPDDPIVLALDLLRRPTATPKEQNAELIARSLRIIRTQHPTLVHNLSPEAVTRWDDYLVD